MLTEGAYRTEVSASFKLSGVYTASLVRLWWMIVVCDDFLDFQFRLWAAVGDPDSRATAMRPPILRVD
jgi:hypothetical protein